MQSYRIDQLDPSYQEQVIQYFTALHYESSVAGLFWLPVPLQFLSPLQDAHHAQCGPYFCALEVEETALTLEFLVRSRTQMHCSCIAVAPMPLRTHMMEYLDQVLMDLTIQC